MDRKNALEILDLPEGATTDDVARRYNVIFKKLKNADINEKGYTEDQIEEAYRFLMGLDYHDPGTEERKQRRREHPNPFFKLLRIDEEKARNAVYYYKWKVLIGLIAVVAVVSVVLSIVNRVEPDLKIILAGEIFLGDTTVMSDTIKADMANVKNPQIQCITLSDQLDGQSLMISEQKLSVEMMAANNDIYIMDLDTYKKYASFGVFTPLDDLKDELGIKTYSKDLEVAVVDENGKELTPPRLYGVDVSGSSMLKDCGVMGDTLIAALFPKGDDPESAKEYLKKLIESVR